MSISVQGISKNFKGRRKGESDNQVLKDVSFEIEEGQFVCLLGPSGCGKTTTLTIVAGFQKPTEGIIEVNGNVVTKPGPDRAFMFHNYALLPLAVIAAIILGLSIAASRIILGVHWLSDVIIGVGIGLLCSYWAVVAFNSQFYFRALFG